MELTVTENARKWFESEVALPKDYGIRFFGKVYGKQKCMKAFPLVCL